MNVLLKYELTSAQSRCFSDGASPTSCLWGSSPVEKPVPASEGREFELPQPIEAHNTAATKYLKKGSFNIARYTLQLASDARELIVHTDLTRQAAVSMLVATSPHRTDERLPRYDRRRTPPTLRLCIRKSWSYQVLGLERRIGKRRQRRAELERRGWPNAVHRAREYERELAGGRRTYQQVADRFGVTRAAVCQYLTIIRCLPGDVVQAVEAEANPARLRALSMKRLARIARLDTDEAKREAVAATLRAG